MKKQFEKLIQLKSAFNIKKYIKDKKKSEIKHNTACLAVTLSILAITAPSSYYLFIEVTSFWTFMRDFLATALSFLSLLLFFASGLLSLDIFTTVFSQDRNYINVNDYFFENQQLSQQSYEYFDNWLSILLSLHLHNESYIKYSEIKEIEASMEFSKEMLSQIKVKDLPEEIKTELQSEHKKILLSITNALKFIERNKLYNNQEFIDLLESTNVIEKMDLAIKKQQNYLIQNQIAQELLNKAREKKGKILEQKEQALNLEKQIEEEEKQLKSLAL